MNNMSRHDGVSCDACLKANFRGRRYKCLVCFDYDLCADCHEEKATTTRHTIDHPMQCILTRQDFELFYSGETLASEATQSLTCPYCGRLGFTETLLMEHVTVEHQDATTEVVVCPICASAPGGDPNHVTDNFNSHITFEHTAGQASAATMELDLSSSGGGAGGGVAGRHGSGRARRMQCQGRGLGRAVPGRNLSFGSVGSGLFPSSRESMDPIAELLSQLHGRTSAVMRQRRQQQYRMERGGRLAVAATSTAASSAAATNSLSSSIVANVLRAGNESIPQASSANGSTTNREIPYGSVVRNAVAAEQSRAFLQPSQQQAAAAGGASAAGNTTTASSSASTAADTGSGTPAVPPVKSQFLLSRICENESEKESPSEAADRCNLVKELILSTIVMSISGDTALPAPSTQSTSDNSTNTVTTVDNNSSNNIDTVDATTQTLPVASYISNTPPVNSSHNQKVPLKGRQPAKNVGSATRPSNTGAINKSSSTVTSMLSGTRSSGGGGAGSGGNNTGNSGRHHHHGSSGGAGNVGGGGGVNAGGVTGGGGGHNSGPSSAVSPPSQARRKMAARGGVESKASEPPPPH